MTALISLHHEIAYILLFVLCIVIYMLSRLLFACLQSGYAAILPAYFYEHTLLELL